MTILRMLSIFAAVTCVGSERSCIWSYIRGKRSALSAWPEGACHAAAQPPPKAFGADTFCASAGTATVDAKRGVCVYGSTTVSRAGRISSGQWCSAFILYFRPARSARGFAVCFIAGTCGETAAFATSWRRAMTAVPVPTLV
jgi:hypothetical protein